MHFAFRVDAGVAMGTGHFVRCLTLAESMLARGADVLFVSRDLPNHLAAMLKALQIALLDMPSRSESQLEDAQAFLESISGLAIDWLIVDSYSLSLEWERAVRPYVKRIAVVDDLANREHDCDLLLDQNFYADATSRYGDLLQGNPRKLLGPHYALVRPNFRSLRSQRERRRAGRQRLLIFFGGTDPLNLTPIAIDAASGCDIEVHVVVGAANPNAQKIAAHCGELGFFCHIETNRMAELMSDCDLCVGAGGTSIWERCCVGLPSIVCVTAANQAHQIRDLADAGYIYAPDFDGLTAAVLRTHIRALMENAALRRVLTSAGMRLVDGDGARRVASAMWPSKLSMRKATPVDSKLLFEWRNHPTVRAHSRHTEPISWSAHSQWMATSLQSEARILLVGLENETPTGVVRFDIDQNYAEVSIYLAPEFHGLGKGMGLLQCAEEWLTNNRPSVSNIKAYVKAENQRSIRMFCALNYTAEGTWFVKRVNSNEL